MLIVIPGSLDESTSICEWILQREVSHLGLYAPGRAIFGGLALPPPVIVACTQPAGTKKVRERCPTLLQPAYRYRIELLGTSEPHEEQ